MPKFTAYLFKDGSVVEPRYSVVAGSVSENKQSVFAEGVCLSTSTAVLDFLDRNDIDAKRVTRSASNPAAYFRSYSKDDGPWWARFWDIREPIPVSGADAVVFLSFGNRIVAMTHGHGRHLLDAAKLVPDFGLKTALNMVDPDKLKVTDSFSPSEVAMQTHKQSGQATRLGEYDLDIYQTLLKSVGGRCREEYSDLATAVQGTDSLKFPHRSEGADLQGSLAALLAVYDSDSYKSSVFDWVDNFRPVKDRELLAKLDSTLLQRVNARDPDISLSIPDPFENNYDSVFRFRRLRNASSESKYPFLEISSYYAKLPRNGVDLTLDDIKRHRIDVEDQNSGFPPRSYSVYRCLHHDVPLEGESYFIESGRWYQVQKDFMALVDRTVESLLSDSWDAGVPYDEFGLQKAADATGKSKEFIYNGQLVDHLSHKGDCELLDTRMVNSRTGKFELCDVLHKPNEAEWYLIHNKYKHGSSALSHLFSQGYVSAHALTQMELLMLANEKIESPALRFPEDIASKRSAVTVVYGVIGKRNRQGDITLPLFSRINLNHFAREIRTLGFHLRLALIEAVAR